MRTRVTVDSAVRFCSECESAGARDKRVSLAMVSRENNATHQQASVVASWITSAEASLPQQEPSLHTDQSEECETADWSSVDQTWPAKVANDASHVLLLVLSAGSQPPNLQPTSKQQIRHARTNEQGQGSHELLSLLHVGFGLPHAAHSVANLS